MGAQSSLNAITGTIIGSALTATKIAEGLDKDEKEPKINMPNEVKEEKVDEGIDAKMAARARRNVQVKINAIYSNKELSNKAKTRRMGKLIDEYNKEIGGNR